jgi:hypothetical protein
MARGAGHRLLAFAGRLQKQNAVRVFCASGVAPRLTNVQHLRPITGRDSIFSKGNDVQMRATTEPKPSPVRTVAAIALAFVVQVVVSGAAAWLAGVIYAAWLGAPADLANVLGILAGSLVGMVVARMACDRWPVLYSRNAVVWSFTLVMVVLLIPTLALFNWRLDRAGPVAALIGTAVSAWVVFRRPTL